jgi:hypothetical protein
MSLLLSFYPMCQIHHFEVILVLLANMMCEAHSPSVQHNAQLPQNR